MLTRFGGFLFRARWPVLLGGVVVILAMGLFGVGLFGHLSDGGFADPSSQSTQGDNLLTAQLGGVTPDVILLLHSQTLLATDPAFASAATQLQNTLLTQHQIATVQSYYTTHDAHFLSHDGHATFLAVQLAGTDQTVKDQEYQAVLPVFTSPTLQVQVGGTEAVNAAITSQASADLSHAETLTFPLVGILLILVFGSLVAASLPLVIGGVSILGAFAFLRILTGITPISVFALNVVTVLGLGLAIDYALFIVTRFREEVIATDGGTREALARTMATAGRTILFSGLTVSVSLLGLLLFPEDFLRSMGLGAIGAVLVAMLAALTILPALLAILGARINTLSLQRLFRRSAPTSTPSEAHGVWYRLSHAVMRWPIPVAAVVLAILVTLGTPFLHAHFSTPDYRVLPPGQAARVVAEQISADFPGQGQAEIDIAVRTTGGALLPNNLASLENYVRQITALPHVLAVQSLVTVDPTLTLAEYQAGYANPSDNPALAAVAQQLAAGDTTKVIVALDAPDFSAAAEQAVRQIRALPTNAGIRPLVGGETAYQMDLFSNLRATLPFALAVIAGAILLLLFLMTGSVVMPIKAVLLNTLSLTATFGALVWIFQDGHLVHVLGFQSQSSIDGTQAILIFALAFGLSMDYEVFLLSRIKEQYDVTDQTREAVATGLQRTGWLISSAALVLAVVLIAFSTARLSFIQQIGVGLAIAVLMDATLVRGLLVPAMMRLLGRWNWWAPAPLRWLWRHIGLHESDALRCTPKTTLQETVAASLSERTQV
jgi:trehalose monomycolate/heme transporter